MNRALGRAALTIVATAVVAIAAAAAFIARGPSPLPPRAPADRPPLLLLTSLPLVFSEDFSVQGNGSAALQALRARYRVVPISVTGPADLSKGRLLLMAHPLAQPAEDLVALDRWVRGGGRVLLFADPMLEWPSKRPLGDLLRPPPMFMDTGLLAHWGLRMEAPDRPGPKVEKLGGFEIVTDSAGQLFGRCSISPDRLVAHCGIGKGGATVIADADLLDAPQLGPRAAHNLDGVLEELARLEHS